VWNAACSELTGYTFEEVRGKCALDLLAVPEEREYARRAYGQMIAGELPPRIEGDLVTKSGQRRWVSWSHDLTRHADGSVELVTSVGIDRTDAWSQEQALRRVQRDQTVLSEAGAIFSTTIDQHEMLSRIAGLATQFLADCCIIDLFDDEGQLRRWKVLHAHPAKQELSARLERVQLVRNKPHVTWTVLETRKPALIADVPPEYLESIAVDREHLQAVRELDAVSWLGLPLLAHGCLSGSLLLIRCRPSPGFTLDDVRLGEDLAFRVAHSLKSARAYRLAQEAIRARDHVLGVVAHDLRNPINTATLASTTLLLGEVQEAPRTLQKLAGSIARSLAHANRLIRDLMDVSGIESGRLTLECALLDPHELISEAVEAFTPIAARVPLEIRTDVRGPLPRLSADRVRLLQILSNLAGNAIKFTEAGGQIELGAEHRDGMVRFWVKDTGPGISPEHVAHLFDLYWQAKPTDRRGVGMGLYIARGIAEGHGGRIWVESTPGVGSTFHFAVPADGACDRDGPAVSAARPDACL
jgi:PAS domain S-box-containing protein